MINRSRVLLMILWFMMGAAQAGNLDCNFQQRNIIDGEITFIGLESVFKHLPFGAAQTRDDFGRDALERRIKLASAYLPKQNYGEVLDKQVYQLVRDFLEVEQAFADVRDREAAANDQTFNTVLGALNPFNYVKEAKHQTQVAMERSELKKVLAKTRASELNLWEVGCQATGTETISVSVDYSEDWFQEEKKRDYVSITNTSESMSRALVLVIANGVDGSEYSRLFFVSKWDKGHVVSLPLDNNLDYVPNSAPDNVKSVTVNVLSETGALKEPVTVEYRGSERDNDIKAKLSDLKITNLDYLHFSKGFISDDERGVRVTFEGVDLPRHEVFVNFSKPDKELTLQKWTSEPYKTKEGPRTFRSKGWGARPTKIDVAIRIAGSDYMHLLGTWSVVQPSGEVVIDDIKFENHGAWVFFTYKLRDMKGVDVDADLYFYDNDGNALKSSDGDYQIGGYVGKSKDIDPDSNDESDSKKVYFPFRELHLAKGVRYDLSAKVKLWNYDASSYIAESENSSFRINLAEPK